MNVERNKEAVQAEVIDLPAVLVIDMSKFSVVEDGVIFTWSEVGEKKSRELLKQAEREEKTDRLVQL